MLLRHIVLLMAVTCLLSAALTTLCIYVSNKFRLTADPRSDRWHAVPTPNTGGVAIFISCAITYLMIGPGRYGGIAAAACAIAVLGFIDDRLRLAPLVKFSGQSLAVIAVIANGVVFHATASYPLNIAITFIWIAGITNAFNLIDNMDGLCAGVTAIICGFRVWSAIQSGDAAGAVLLAILAGGFLGFLWFNYRPAKIFMGDAGSMFAGFTLASLTIAAPLPQTRVFISAILYPVLTFLYPLFDTVLVSVLRKLAGRPISVGGRDHSSHRLASLGLGERRVVWLLWLLTAIGGVGGILTQSMPIGVLAIAFFLVLATAIFGIFLASLPGYELPQTALASRSWVRKWIPTLRAGVMLLVDTLIAGVALLISFLLKWEDGFSGKPVSELLSALPIVMGCQAAACLFARTFYLSGRWVGIHDILAVGRCVLLSSGGSILIASALGLQGYSRGIIIVSGFLSFSAMTGSRLLLRILWRLLASPPTGRKVALLATAESAELLIRILRHDKELDASPVLTLDTNLVYKATRIDGIPVYAVGSDPTSILREASIDLLVLRASSNPLTSSELAVVDACNALAIPVLELECLLSPMKHSHGHGKEFPSLSSSVSASV